MTVKQDVASFCARHGWKRENVTIRVQSGPALPAGVWPVGGSGRRKTRTQCIVFEAATAEAAAAKVTLPSRREHTRTDARPADAVWNEFQFVHYPDGRPTRAKDKK